MEILNNVREAQVDSLVAGEGVGEIKSQFLMPIDEDATLDGCDAEVCRVRFKTLRASDNVPYSLDNGVLLMADEEAKKSIADLDFELPSYIIAVDVDFNASANEYPEEYDGTFKVHTHALIKHLYVAVGSGMKTPVDVLQMLKSKNAETKGKYDELQSRIYLQIQYV